MVVQRRGYTCRAKSSFLDISTQLKLKSGLYGIGQLFEAFGDVFAYRGGYS